MMLLFSVELVQNSSSESYVTFLGKIRCYVILGGLTRHFQRYVIDCVRVDSLIILRLNEGVGCRQLALLQGHFRR